MLVLGDMRKYRSLMRLWLSFILLVCWYSPLAAESLILLRKGPGSAFPVVFEIPADHRLTPVRIQGDWVLLSDELRQGWAHQDSLAITQQLTPARLWLIRESRQLSDWQLQLGLDSQQALLTGIRFPWQQHSLALRFSHSAAESSWQSLELAGETDLGRSDWRAGIALGLGHNDRGQDRWHNDAREQTTALISANLDWQRQINKQLAVLVRLKSEQAVSGNSANHNSLALVWNLKL